MTTDPAPYPPEHETNSARSEDSHPRLVKLDLEFSGTDCAGSSCSACRWWVEDDHTMAPHPQRECRNEKFLHESGWPSAGDAAKSLTYQYYEGGQIWTGPDFGCVHFEQND